MDDFELENWENSFQQLKPLLSKLPNLDIVLAPIKLHVYRKSLAIFREHKLQQDLNRLWLEQTDREMKAGQVHLERNQDGAIQSQAVSTDLDAMARFNIMKRVQDLESMILALQDAVRILENELTIPLSNQPMDERIAAQWIEGVSETRNDKIREMWSRLLAGEIQQPNRYSLHTITLLRRLSPNEAQLIEMVSTLYIGNCLLHVNPPDGLKQIANSFTISDLRDIGILRDRDEPLALRPPPPSHPRAQIILPCKTLVLIVHSNSTQSDFAIAGTPLTLAGLDLCRLSNQETDRAFLEHIQALLSAEGTESEIAPRESYFPEQPVPGALVDRQWP